MTFFSYIIGGCLVGLFALYCILYFAAELPKSGTLEWIRLYDRPKPSFFGCARRLSLWDAFRWLIPAGVAFLVPLIDFFRHPWDGFPVGNLPVCIGMALSAAAVYILITLGTGNPIAALLAGLFVGIQPILLLPYGAPTLWAVVLFWLWASRRQNWGLGWPCLLLGGVLMGIGCSQKAETLLLLVPMVLTILLVGICRREFWAVVLAQIAACVVLACGSGLGMYCLTASDGGAYLAGLFSGAGLGGFLLTEAAAVWDRFSRVSLSNALPALLILMPATVFCLGIIPVAWDYFRRRMPFTLFILIWIVFFLGEFLIFPTYYLLSAAVALLMGYMTDRLFCRKHPAVALCGSLGLLVMTAALLIIIIF